MELPELGLGVIYVPGLEPLLEPGNSCIDVIEIEPQPLWNFVSAASNPYVMPDRTLAHLKQFSQRKIIHSVGFAPGGTWQCSTEFTDALIRTIKSFDAPWVSEHLSFTHVQSGKRTFHTGFMLPTLQSKKGAQTAARTITSFSQRLPVPLAIETTVNYLRPRPGELSDGDFTAMVVEESDCGILLDLHNIWTNERNGRQTAKEFLASIPLDRVWEIHLAGGFELDDYWLDAHSGAVPDSVLDLAQELAPQLANLKAIVYEIFPSFLPVFGLSEIQRQLEKIRDSVSISNASKMLSQDRSSKRPYPIAQISTVDEVEVSSWEVALGELIVSGKAEGSIAQELSEDPAIQLIRKLVWKFRAGAVVKSINMLTRLIQISAGNVVLEKLLDGYFEEFPPQLFASEEAMGFIGYIEKKELTIPYISDVISYETCLLRACLENETQFATLTCDPRTLITALDKGVIPDLLESGPFELQITA